MLDWDQFKTVRFDAQELISISTAKEFSYERAQKWMLDHEMFSIQIVVIYLMAIFVMKQFMNSRQPFKLDWPIRAWNISIAFLSGACAAGMTNEFFSTLFGRGINASLCSSSDTFFHGSNGYFLWGYHIIRLFEFTDTLFIILRKQPLLFIHWYHHALTLYISWYTFAHPSPFSRYGIYVNAIIHTVMYTYYFLRASKVHVPLFVAKIITAAQIAQFVIVFWSVIAPAVINFGYGMPCELDTNSWLLALFMDLCYLYLFIEFYRSKYNRKSDKVEKQEKEEKKFENNFEMISSERLWVVKFNATELYDLVTANEFDRHRAGRWMDDHIVFTFQAGFIYLVTIFTIQKWMQNREPFKLQFPVAVWNFSIALLSGVCAATITPEFFRNIKEQGYSATLCSTREEVYSGAPGLAIFMLLFARLPEFIDTLFIVLRKQPLLFIHYYHHAFTLCFTWSTYSYFAPGMRHPAYVNSLVHTVMYSYYLATTLKIRPPSFVARCITLAQIVQFVYIFYALTHLTVLFYSGDNCLQDPTGLTWTWFMDISYLYLFIDFYVNKYKGSKATKEEKVKKID